MFGEGRACEWLRGDIGEVLGGGVFDEDYGGGGLGAADHGVAGCHPFGFGGDTTAASAVDEDAGVGEDGSRAIGGEAEFAKEDAEAEDRFGAADGLEQFGGAGGVADGRGQVA